MRNAKFREPRLPVARAGAGFASTVIGKRQETQRQVIVSLTPYNASMQLIDTHLHLDEEGVSPGPGRGRDPSSAAGVAAMISIGVTAATERAAVALAQSPCDGLRRRRHSGRNYVSQAAPGTWEIIPRAWPRSPKAGGDRRNGPGRYWDHAPFEMQVEFFGQTSGYWPGGLICRVVVHCREA